MFKLSPINLDNGVIQIHPLRERELLKHDKLINDIFEILSSDKNTEFIPEKRVADKQVITSWMLGVTIEYEKKLGYTHFLTLKDLDKIVGVIDIKTPKRIQREYPIKDKWFIEYYLNKQLWGRGIMSGAVNAVIQNMKGQGISNIAAVCMPDNRGSIRILEKCGFKRVRKFDAKQDYYELE